MQVRDAVTIVNGPRSCAFLSSHGMVASARRALDRYGAYLERPLSPGVHCTDMDEGVVIFGGNSDLEKALGDAAAKGPAALAVVTTCASGIIGDDPVLAVRNAAERIRGIPLLLVQADGDINGDYMQGVLDAVTAVAQEWIDPGVESLDDSVNIVGEKNLATNTEGNFHRVRMLLDELGIKINCRFIRNCTTSQLASFLNGRLNLLAYDDHFGRTVRDLLVERFGATFSSTPFPVGFQATAEWLREVAASFGKPSAAEEIISSHEARYRRFIADLRPSLQGRRLFIAAQNHCLDWVLDTALDLGMEIVKVGILESVWEDTFLTRYADRVPLVWPYPREQREEDMLRLEPDLTLVNYAWRKMPEGRRFDHISICPDVGFFAGVKTARRWQRLMRLPAQEGWRRDA